MDANVLSSFIWENILNPASNIELEIIQTYKPERGNCQLCINEKVHIDAQAGNQDVVNKRTEISQTCHHKARYKAGQL